MASRTGLGRLLRRIEQAAELRLEDRLGAAAGVELVVDIFGVGVDRVPADAHDLMAPKSKYVGKGLPYACCVSSNGYFHFSKSNGSL